MWFQDAVGVAKTVSLEAQAANQRLPNAGGGGSGRTFRVMVRSSPADSPIVQEWRNQRDGSITNVFGSRRRPMTGNGSN